MWIKDKTKNMCKKYSLKLDCFEDEEVEYFVFEGYLVAVIDNGKLIENLIDDYYLSLWDYKKKLKLRGFDEITSNSQLYQLDTDNWFFYKIFLETRYSSQEQCFIDIAIMMRKDHPDIPLKQLMGYEITISQEDFETFDRYSLSELRKRLKFFPYCKRLRQKVKFNDKLIFKPSKNPLAAINEMMKDDFDRSDFSEDEQVYFDMVEDMLDYKGWTELKKLQNYFKHN